MEKSEAKDRQILMLVYTPDTLKGASLQMSNKYISFKTFY